MHAKRLLLGLVMMLTMADSCNNGVVGVQDYGTVNGRVLDATTNQPIPNALISVGSLFTETADAQGAFTMQHVPIGFQQVTVRSPGWTTVSQQVRVRKDQTISAGFIRLVPLTKPADTPTLPPPPTAAPSAAPEPTWTPASEPSASPSASANPVTNAIPLP